MHDRAYIDLVKRELANVTGAKELSTGDTEVTAGSLAAARAAAGGVLNAVDSVMSGRLKNAFCAVRYTACFVQSAGALFIIPLAEPLPDRAATPGVPAPFEICLMRSRTPYPCSGASDSAFKDQQIEDSWQ